MGDCTNKQLDLMSRDLLGHTNIEIPNSNENGATTSFPESYWYFRPIPDVSNRFSFSEALNALNEARNAHRDNAYENVSNYELNDPLNLLSNEVYGNNNNNNNFSNLATNSGSFELGARQGRYNNLPYILAAVPQFNVNQHLSKTQAPGGPPGYYSQVPISSSEPTLFFHGSQRPQYFRTVQPQRNIEYSWFKSKLPIAKGNYKPIYTPDSGTTRNFGPIGAEMAALRRARRNYPTQGNMVRIFPDNRTAYNNPERISNYFLSPKQSEIFTHNFNTNFNPDENVSFEYKYTLSPPNEKEGKKNKSTFVTTSVHLGGLLTIPKRIDHVIDNCSQSSSDRSNNIKITNNLAIFKETTIEGCIEIQKLISHYNIKSPTINIENFCKSVSKQINNSKNIMQMEPIMREMILGYLYLTSSWISLASVLSVPRDHTSSLDNCLESLTKEFSVWQKKSKNMLEQIILSLKKIPLEHEKYIAGIYKSSSSSSENSTIFSDDSYSDSELVSKDLYNNNNNNHFWTYENMHDDFNEYPNQKVLNDAKSVIKENCIRREPTHRNNSKYKHYGNKYDLNYNRNNCTNNQHQIPYKLLKEDVNDADKFSTYNERKMRTRQTSLGGNSTIPNERKYPQNTNSLFPSGKGKKNYSSNRHPGKNKYSSSISPRFNGRK